MIDRILPLMKFCSVFLVISLVHGVRYIFFRRKLKLIYEEHKEDIHKAIRCDKMRFSVFLIEPLDTGNDMLDLLLFKIYSSAKWFLSLFFFYWIGVAFFYFFTGGIKES